VLAGVEALCDEEFALVGISGTTDAVAPLFIVNGPVRRALAINGAAGALGPGFRANATIGRALRLVWANVGGARPGGISMSTFGNPARYGCCFAEHEEASPWEPLSVEHGFAPGESTLAAFAGEPLQVVVDARSRSAPSTRPRSRPTAGPRPTSARTCGSGPARSSAPRPTSSRSSSAGRPAASPP
jgi:hypothetical protein